MRKKTKTELEQAIRLLDDIRIIVVKENFHSRLEENLHEVQQLIFKHQDKSLSEIPTDEEIDSEFPLDETFTDTKYALNMGKRQGAKWMRDL
jgi:hypothetical protein